MYNYRTYGFWLYQELQPLVGKGVARERKGCLYLSTPNHGSHWVRVSSTRLECFRRSPVCVMCGVVGSIWMLQSNANPAASAKPHLNLYAYGRDPRAPGVKRLIQDDGLVLMTQDHILPLSCGGLTVMDNLQTMCEICNQFKGNALPKPHRLTAESNSP
jgi:hypothetical protein